MTLDTLRFVEGGLYGRADEIRELHDVYRRVKIASSNDVNNGATNSNNTREMVLVHGDSGVGKTALVGSLRNRVMRRGDFFISGKFDLTKRSSPYAGIVEALSELPGQMQQNKGEETQKSSRNGLLRQSLGEELTNVMLRCVPTLGALLGENDTDSVSHLSQDLPPSQLGTSDSKNQFFFAFRSFLRHICEGAGKVMVLFVDDLQCEFSSSRVPHYLCRSS